MFVRACSVQSSITFATAAITKSVSKRSPHHIFFGCAPLSTSATINTIMNTPDTSAATVQTLQGTQFFLYDEVASTMDVCKQLVKRKSGVPSVDSGQLELDDVFAVLSKEQHNGRGSRGRTWEGMSGNMFLTVAVKMSRVPCRITLIPLRVGTLVSPHIRSRVQTANMQTYLKWPNDVLIGKEKVCGTIVEIEDDRVLIGIGCNVARAPTVPTAGDDAGRDATCLAAHSAEVAADPEAYLSLAADIAADVRSWASAAAAATATASDANSVSVNGGQIMEEAEVVVKKFEGQMDLSSAQRLRSGDDAGKQVLPLQVNSDGTLRVRVEETGEERTLVVEYLW